MIAPAVSLDELARAAGDLLEGFHGSPSVRVRSLAYDSGSVAEGSLFFCVPGTRRDGHDFAAEAVRAGAVGLVVERRLGLDASQVIVSDARRAMGRMAAAFFGRPSDDLLVIGVTGTNGKTTTSYLMDSILRASGRRTGLIGTIESRVAGEVRPGVRTTPESIDLQSLFARMRAADVAAVAMEVTSHALAMHRVEGVCFEAAVFTNLSQDHLDFHSDMEHYFSAKRLLFAEDRAHCAVLNLDDPYGRRISEASSIPVLTFGFADDAQVRARTATVHGVGTSLSVTTPQGDVELFTPLVGSFNVSNCLAACAATLQVGIALPDIARGIASVHSVPGRFERVDRGQPFIVVVDYAHTPDSLENALGEARRLARSSGGRAICVFGCGGDRDRGKRPLMGEVAARLADVVVVTSDNPRSEEPEAIIEAILHGVRTVRPAGADEVLVDRREAIAAALGGARAGDVVVIAGKGHETGQEFDGCKIPFDDRSVAGESLASLGWSKAARNEVASTGEALP
jgi:UDP-N-acetylmuramoyl-L-alanyl-D-glutamate--2,6-diaminopimelate ligase